MQEITVSVPEWLGCDVKLTITDKGGVLAHVREPGQGWEAIHALGGGLTIQNNPSLTSNDAAQGDLEANDGKSGEVSRYPSQE